MTKRRNVERFAATVKGEEIIIECYTTDARNGFCHTAKVTTPGWDHISAKQSWCNRTWERFRYESALKKAITKFPEEMREALHAQLIERKSAEEAERAEAMFENFKGLYDGLNDENKKRMANLPPMQTEDDARAYMGYMALLSLMQ